MRFEQDIKLPVEVLASLTSCNKLELPGEKHFVARQKQLSWACKAWFGFHLVELARERAIHVIRSAKHATPLAGTSEKHNKCHFSLRWLSTNKKNNKSFITFALRCFVESLTTTLALLSRADFSLSWQNALKKREARKKNWQTLPAYLYLV